MDTYYPYDPLHGRMGMAILLFPNQYIAAMVVPQVKKLAGRTLTLNELSRFLADRLKIIYGYQIDTLEQELIDPKIKYISARYEFDSWIYSSINLTHMLKLIDDKCSQISLLCMDDVIIVSFT